MEYGKIETGKMYFSSNEAAEIVGVEIKTLREWERQFKTILHPKKGATGKRVYKASDIETIKKIKTLIEEENLPPDGIVLRLGEEKQNRQDDITEKRHREFLLKIRKNLINVLEKIRG